MKKKLGEKLTKLKEDKQSEQESHEEKMRFSFNMIRMMKNHTDETRLENKRNKNSLTNKLGKAKSEILMIKNEANEILMQREHFTRKI